MQTNFVNMITMFFSKGVSLKHLLSESQTSSVVFIALIIEISEANGLLKIDLIEILLFVLGIEGQFSLEKV